ncbi:hypothetical protein KIN20_014027 [Parelaphostrongylus tenuis]|uniref:Uncharacterized protein n=1 Tax=Parelaphostrongylus tenuis TaxID=148309 RepID=A0AAD5MED7_PARTN|nr:hypothetical protein KIN20_014027 [Parelaphostrongylus tenuis]
MSTTTIAKFKLFFEKPPRFTITYSGKEDLHQSFKNQVEKWTTREGAASYWVDFHGDRVTIDDVEELYNIVRNENGTINVIVRDEAIAPGSDPEYAAAIEKGRRKKSHTIDRNRDQGSTRGQQHSRSSRDHGRSHSRESSEREYGQDCCGHCHPYYGLPFFVCPAHGRPSPFRPFDPYFSPRYTCVGLPPFCGMEPGCYGSLNGGK